MTGRIKLLKDGVPVAEKDEPEIGYNYDKPGDFDKTCGTFGLDSFTLSKPQQYCPDRFVCNKEVASPAVQAFSSCIDAMNCFMVQGMTTNIKAGSQQALFLHQMIPHHQNAVNMAKSLLPFLSCEDLTDEDSEDCVLKGMLYAIINEQNYQVQAMRGILESNDAYPLEDTCKVEFPSLGGDSPVSAPVATPVAEPTGPAPVATPPAPVAEPTGPAPVATPPAPVAKPTGSSGFLTIASANVAFAFVCGLIFVLDS